MTVILQTELSNFCKPGLLRTVAKQQFVGSSVTAVKHMVLQSQPLLCNLCQCVIDELKYAHRENVQNYLVAGNSV